MLNKDIEDAVRKQAQAIGMDEAALLAIVDVESAGEAFWTVGGDELPIMRFEGHYFYKRLAGKDRKKAVEAGLASPKVGGVPNPKSGAARYALLQRASAINEDAALESCSWGLGQVMGSNWQDLGRSSVKELVEDAHSLQGQIDLMTDFIEANGLDDEVRRKDWVGFAKGYNGPKYKQNSYDTKLKQAYAKYSKKSGDDVAIAETKRIQGMLNSILGSKLKVDGDYGPQTERAIRDFQIKQGLTVDGIMGPLTQAELEAEYKAQTAKTEKAVGGSTLALGSVGSIVTEATGWLEPLVGYSDIIKGVFVVLVLVGVFFTFKSLIFKK